MNIHNSGKIPERIKRLLAAAAVLSLFCSGCSPSESVSAESAEPAYSSNAEGSHIPVEDGSSDSGDSSQSRESSAASSDGGFSSNGSSDRSSSDNAQSQASSSSVQSGESFAVSSETPPESSAAPPVTSETSEPDPPAPVVVPDVAMPYSPGTDCAVSENGVIDYSNASSGYVSATYTGSVSKIKFRIECGGTKYDYDLTPGKTEYFPLSLGSGKYTLTIFENTSGTRYKRAVEEKNVQLNIANSLSPFLYPNQLSFFSSSSECVYKAAEVCAGKTGDIEKIAAVFTWITDNITYDNSLADAVRSGLKGYIPDPDRTYSSREGICFDYASLMCAMLRSQGIPTRLVKGNAAPDIYHAWNEVYTDETGWITPELMLKKAGYNIADSTFYASADDKAQIASYISDPSNYQAVYYY